MLDQLHYQTKKLKGSSSVITIGFYPSNKIIIYTYYITSLKIKFVAPCHVKNEFWLIVRRSGAFGLTLPSVAVSNVNEF
jgi:hypothetical protein